MGEPVEGKYLVGTSGWSYKHWRGAFYPDTLGAGKWLEFYAENFSTVEVNYSFYRLPSEKTLDGWVQRSPEGFKFTLKASKAITHTRKLRDCDDELGRFFAMASRMDSYNGFVSRMQRP